MKMSNGSVCLTFDFDAFSSYFLQGMTGPGMASRGEFSATAVPRILRMLKRERIPSTWYIPGHTAETFPDLVRRIRDAGHEIALHGYLHEAVSYLPEEQERAILERSIEVLHRITGEFPKGNRTPGWDYSVATVEILVAAGVEYDSSLMSQDFRPFYSRTRDVPNTDGPFEFGEQSTLVQLPVHWSLCDFPYYEFLFSPPVLLQGLRRADDVMANWLDDVKFMIRDYDDGVATITMHPEVIGRGHRLLGLERLIEDLRALDVDFVRQDLVSSQYRAGRQYGVEREV